MNPLVLLIIYVKIKRRLFLKKLKFYYKNYLLEIVVQRKGIKCHAYIKEKGLEKSSNKRNIQRTMNK